MNQIRVNASVPYDVLIGKGLLAQSGQMIAKIGKQYQKVCVITDDTVEKLYGKIVMDSLQGAEMNPVLYAIPHGEKSKSFTMLEEVYDFLTKNHLTRTDLIIALGGGVVGDLTGFAAATYLRGLDYVQIPTTLIAQTDSSVGGKTAVNTPRGKNLVGAFYQPKLVLCDIDTLKTLDTVTFSEAMAEVVKYALLSGDELFSLLEQPDLHSHLEDIVTKCIQIKADIVCGDEFDRGKRMLLNLGHTIGHAVENASGYTVSHGAGVAIGMAVILRACVVRGMLAPSDYDRFHRLLNSLSLPDCYDEASLDELIDIASADKKRAGSILHVILCDGIGKCEIQAFTMEEFRQFLSIS
jgi:3-dehydroquinate synthase